MESTFFTDFRLDGFVASTLATAQLDTSISAMGDPPLLEGVEALPRLDPWDLGSEWGSVLCQSSVNFRSLFVYSCDLTVREQPPIPIK